MSGLADVVGIGRDWLRSGGPARRDCADFDRVRRYVLFVGYPRSGHSIVGGLLDAHPNAVVSHEQAALRYVHLRFDRCRLFWLLRRAALAQAGEDRPSGDYRYAVPGQWQGRHARIYVIGDKQGGGATLRLQAAPYLLDRLRRTVGVPLAIVHVCRNPFDNIATIARRAVAAGETADVDLGRAEALYFSLCATIDSIRSSVPGEELIEFRHEDLIANPATVLAGLCRRLELEATADYLRDCASIVYASANRSRHGVQWSVDRFRSVQDSMSEYRWLAGYTFDD